MKTFFFALLRATGILRLVTWINRRKVTILCYHSVSNRADPRPNDVDQLHLGAERFLRQLDYLEAHHPIIPLSEFVRAQRARTQLPAGAVVLTFDDGFRNFFSVVAPILRARGIPATSFVITGPDYTKEVSGLNGSWCLEDDDSYLSWDEVRQLADGVIDFGSHTWSHPRLSDIPLGEARAELEDSLKALADKLRSTDVPLAYPHGRTSEAVNNLAQSVGYSCGLTTALGQNGSGCDLFALRRTVISAHDDVQTFAARVSGLTWWWSVARNLITVPLVAKASPNQRRYDTSVAGESET